MGTLVAQGVGKMLGIWKIEELVMERSGDRVMREWE